MHDAIKSLIDWPNLPRREVAAGNLIIAAGDSADLLFCLESGHAVTDGATLRETFAEGDYLLLCEALALDHYVTSVIASSDCRLVAVRRGILREALAGGSALAWPLSQSIAVEVTQRRQAG